MHHVLIVDDSPTDATHMAAMLERGGYTTSVAGSAEEGVAKARETRPDLILMDVVLPGMSGFAATRRISRDPATAAIPVVIVSVRDMESDKAWGLRQGACAYLTKPLSPEDLLAVVARNIEHAT